MNRSVILSDATYGKKGGRKLVNSLTLHPILPLEGSGKVDPAFDLF